MRPGLHRQVKRRRSACGLQVPRCTCGADAGWGRRDGGGAIECVEAIELVDDLRIVDRLIASTRPARHRSDSPS